MRKREKERERRERGIFGGADQHLSLLHRLLKRGIARHTKDRDREGERDREKEK